MNKLLSVKLILNNFKTNSSNVFVRNNSNLVKVIDDEKFQLRRIVMSNVKQRNSLGVEMIQSLESAIKTTDYEKTRVLVISSSCPIVFSAGHNLKELTTEKGSEFHRKIFKQFSNLCIDLKKLPIPTIAEVQGKNLYYY